MRWKLTEYSRLKWERNLRKKTRTGVQKKKLIDTWCESKIKIVVNKASKLNTCFFYKQRFFSAQPNFCLTFWWIELQMLLRCCLTHISIVIMRHFLHLLYLCPCQNLVLFMSYLCDLSFTLSPFSLWLFV